MSRYLFDKNKHYIPKLVVADSNSLAFSLNEEKVKNFINMAYGKKVSEKRFKKLLMSKGFQRNTAKYLFEKIKMYEQKNIKYFGYREYMLYYFDFKIIKKV